MRGGYVVNRETKALVWPLFLVMALIAPGPAVSQPIPREAAAEEMAVAAAEQWLALVDQGRYAESWETAAPYFRAAVARDRWEEAMNGFRKPLGDLSERRLSSARFTDSLPGAPDGTYLVIQFRTSFQSKKSAVETVTPMLDGDGTWRVSGYYIQ